MDERKRRSAAIVCHIISMMLAALMIYVMSVGPAFAYRSRKGRASAILKVYRPLFVVIPSDVMSQYLDWWGVSELEAFFLIEPTQLGGGIEESGRR